MDKSFNGFRYSSTLGCLMDDSGEKIRMCHSSTQIFLLLTQNLNKLVTRERLLNRVPADGPKSDDTLNECIDEIRHVVGDDRLKTIPRVGYLLTPDTTTKLPETSTKKMVKCSSVRTIKPDDRIRPMAGLIKELVFNFQWVICTYQKSPRAWIGSFVLIAVFLLSSAGNAVSSTTGHIAYDRADANACSNLMANCASCVPNLWQTSSIFAHSNWFLSIGCERR